MNVLNETEYYRNLTAPLNYCSTLRGEIPARGECCTCVRLSLLEMHNFSPALSISWSSDAYLIKIPFSKLLLMAYVDLSDASLRRKTKRCRFLEKAVAGCHKSQTSDQTSGLTWPEACGTLMSRASSTPPVVIPLVYIILELRPTKNKQRFELKASEILGVLRKREQDPCVIFVFSQTCVRRLQTHIETVGTSQVTLEVGSSAVTWFGKSPPIIKIMKRSAHVP